MKPNFIYNAAIAVFIMLMPVMAMAQNKPANMPEHDSKLYYFGITFGFNYSAFQISHTQSFASKDTFRAVQGKFKPGFNLGLMGNLRLNNRFDLRFVPALIFAEKGINITDSIGTIDNKSIESIYMDLPLQLKFKSDRINNFRFYGLVGGKFDYDLAANARSRRTDEWLRVSSTDFGLELGVGLEFFYPNFIFSPEIKISQGFVNSHYDDGSIPLSNTIDKMRTRMFVFSIHLEG